MSSLTRGQRRLLQYAAHDGQLPNLKRKRAEDIAPVLQQKAQKRHRRFANTTDVSSPSLPLCGDVLNFLQEHSPKAPRKLRRSQLRLVNELSNIGDDEEEEFKGRGSSGFAVKRMETQDNAEAFAMIAFAALQRRALLGAEESQGASLLVIVEGDAEVMALASHVKKTYKMTHALVLDGERLPTFPALPNAHLGAVTLAERTVLVITSLQSFLAVDGRSALWKFIGAYVVLLRSSCGKIPAAVVGDMTEAAKRDFLMRLCRRRWQCLGHVRVAAVIAPSQRALFAPLADVLTTLTSVDDVKPGNKVIATNTDGDVTNNNDNNSSNNNNNTKKKKNISIINTTSNSSSSSSIQGRIEAPEAGLEENLVVSAAAAAMRQPVTAHYAVVEGGHRFQTLYALLMALRTGQGVVVHFATKEACHFMYNVLYALGELPSSLLLLTDYEGPSTYACVKDTDEDRRRLCVQFNKIIEEASGKNISSATGKDRVVLLSAFGVVPQRGTIFIQYDIILDIVNFAQFVGDVLTPGAYKDGEDKDEIKGKRTNMVDNAAATRPDAPVVKRAMYQHILVLFRRNELQAALKHLQSRGKRLQIRFESMAQLPSVTRFLLSLQKMRSLHKKQFAVQNEAYAAYRATMLLYSIIGSRDVYDERSVDLTKVAEEFGYTVPPILDLRTRDTAFRPKEDVFRAAKERATMERRRLRAYAAAHIVGEAPEPHVADVDDNDDNANERVGEV